jgi:hypothetical protein
MIKLRLPKDKIDTRKLELEIYREFDDQLKFLKKELLFLKLYLLKIIRIRKNIRSSKWNLIKFIFNANFKVIYYYLKDSKKAVLNFWRIKGGIRIAEEGLNEMNEYPLTKILKKYNEA